jgi:hypothetical protein
MRPGAAEGLRQLSRQEHPGERATVVEVPRAPAGEDPIGAARAPDEDLHVGILDEEADGRPGVRGSAVRPRARDPEVGNVDRELAERAKAPLDLDDADHPTLREVVRDRAVHVGELGGHRPARLLSVDPRPVDGHDADLLGLAALENVHLEEGKEPPLEVAEVALQARKAVADAGLEPRGDGIAGDQATRGGGASAAARGGHVPGDQLGRGLLAHGWASRDATGCAGAKKSGRASASSQ